MTNFYRRFIPGAAKDQATLNDMLKDPKTKEEEIAFDNCRKSLKRATELVYPDPTAELMLITDASDVAIGAVIEQISEGRAQPLAFLSKKLKQAQRKYSPYDRELLAIYTAIKHFRHMLEGRKFAVYTDYKPLVYAFNKDQLQSSSRQTQHLKFISQFTTDIRYVTGTKNVVADALLRVENINQVIDIEMLAETQENDEELQQVIKQKQLGIKLEKVPIPGSDKRVYCDVTKEKPRPYVTQPFRRQVFTA